MKFEKDFRNISLQSGDLVIIAHYQKGSAASGFNYGIILNNKLYYYNGYPEHLLRTELLTEFTISTSRQLDEGQVIKLETLTEYERKIKTGLLTIIASDPRDKVPFVSNFNLDKQMAKSMLV